MNYLLTTGAGSGLCRENWDSITGGRVHLACGHHLLADQVTWMHSPGGCRDEGITATYSLLQGCLLKVIS